MSRIPFGLRMLPSPLESLLLGSAAVSIALRDFMRLRRTLMNTNKPPLRTSMDSSSHDLPKETGLSFAPVRLPNVKDSKSLSNWRRELLSSIVRIDYQKIQFSEVRGNCMMFSALIPENRLFPQCGLVCATLFALTTPTFAQHEVDRTVLPVREPAMPVFQELDARAATPPLRWQVSAPADAPNVVIILLDDIGFGHSSAFGGPCKMPTLEQLSQNGLKYNRFHTTALCSPTRTALLTGYNHHSNNAGAIMEVATAFPGNTGIRRNRLHRWQKCCDRTVTPRQHGASTMRRLLGKSVSADRLIAGQHTLDLTSFMVSLGERRTNGIR